jgi:hypothetical protein
MNRTLLAGFLVLVLVLVGAASYLTEPVASQSSPNEVSVEGSKLAILNQGNTWVRVEMNLNLVGTDRNYYLDSFIQPGGNVTIDLSQFFGYENQKLPPSSSIRIQYWKGLFSPTPGGTSDLKLTFLAWSNTLYPGSDAETVEASYGSLPVAELPDSITESVVLSGDGNPIVLATSGRVVHAEEVITVDPLGRVTITVTDPPEMCEVFAKAVTGLA